MTSHGKLQPTLMQRRKTMAILKLKKSKKDRVMFDADGFVFGVLMIDFTLAKCDELAEKHWSNIKNSHVDNLHGGLPICSTKMRAGYALFTLGIDSIV